MRRRASSQLIKAYWTACLRVFVWGRGSYRREHGERRPGRCVIARPRSALAPLIFLRDVFPPLHASGCPRSLPDPSPPSPLARAPISSL